MFRTISAASIIATLLVFVTFDLALAASCSGSYNTWASRCRTKYATDKSCVSDHCAPKLATCKSSGCWQQGGDFGNALTCNLERK